MYGLTRAANTALTQCCVTAVQRNVVMPATDLSRGTLVLYRVVPERAMKRAIPHVLVASMLTVPFSIAVAGSHSHQGGQQEREAKKEQATDAAPAPESGSFDIKAVSQLLTRISNGTIRRVTANDTSDANQIGLIRANLKKQAEQFSSGMLPPASRPGAAPVAGFSTLQAAAPGQLHGQSFEVRAGAEIRYTSSDPSIAAALQLWLESENSAAGAPQESIMRRSQVPQ